MPDWTIVQECPSHQEYNRLRASAGWRAFPENQCIAGLRSSLYCLCARLRGEAVGMGRVVGDGAIYFYLQDVVVVPKHQRQGLGTAIVQKLMQHLGDNAPPGASIGLFAAQDAAHFYAKFGFVARSDDRPGMQWIR